MWRWAIRAVLVLVLLALVFMRFGPKQPSYGFPVLLVAKECEGMDVEVHNRKIHLQLKNRNQVRINGDDLALEQVAARLAGIYTYRNERILDFEAANEALFQDVMATLDRIEGEKQGVSVILVTPTVRDKCGLLRERMFDSIFKIGPQPPPPKRE